MATEEYIEGQRWSPFHFYASGKANGWEDQSINPGVLFKVNEVRLHLTSAFASVEDFVIKNSSIKGLGFSFIFLSHALNGSTDIHFMWSQPYMFFPDDHLVFTASMVSNTTTWGLEVLGWAVRG